MKEDTLKSIVIEQRKKAFWGLLLLIVLLLAVGTISVTTGRAGITAPDVWKIVLGKTLGISYLLDDIKGSTMSIVWNIRLPRIIVGMIVGCGLAVAGAIYQAVLMNPLADSFTMGVSPGAAFGASIALFLNMFFGNSFSIPIFAFCGALLALVTVVSLSRTGSYSSTNNLIICGIIISSILSAAISFIKSMAGEQVAAIVNWLIGSLAARTWEQTLVATPVVIILSILASMYAGDLNILSLGDREAKNLGLNALKIRRIFLGVATLLTAVCVSISGIIGFIGLIVPHILRMAFGSDNKILLPLSAFCGALLLSAADLVGRTILEVEVPVGVLTTLLGGPFFFYIFRKRVRSE